MRLLHVTHQYRPAIGGSEQYFADLSEALVVRGHAVDVVTTRSSSVQSWRSELPPFEMLNGVRVYRYPSLRRGRLGWYALKYGYGGRKHIGGPLLDPLLLFGNGPLAPAMAWHILSKGRCYDAIHLQTLPYAQVVYGYLSARLARRPVIITPHLHVDQPEVFDLDIYNRVLRGADLVIAVSEREVSYFVERGIKPERILVAGNGIKPEEFPSLDQHSCRARLGIPKDAFVVLFLGRKVQYKGIETLLEAIVRLGPHHPTLHLVTAGPSTPDFRDLSGRFASLPRWIDLDRVDDGQKLDLLNACDVLALPSSGEAFGIVFLEAWALKKPVIGARAGAIPWVIDAGEDGLLAEPGDPSDLGKAVETLIRDPDLRRQLGEAGRRKVLQRYTVERIALKVEGAYHDLVAGEQVRGCFQQTEGKNV